MGKSDVVILAVAILGLLGGGVASAAAATPGFAVYKVQVSNSSYSYSLTVNETVSATSSPATDNLILKVASQTWNFNYSRAINSSSEVSPFLPSITNQSFSFGTGTGNLTASIIANGTKNLQFASHTYSLSDYSLSASGTVNGSSFTLNGAISTFPSGLVYSVTLNTAGQILPVAGVPGVLGGNLTALSLGPATVSLTLLSTSLSLNAASPSSAAQVASITFGAVAAISALALGLGVKQRSKHSSAAPEEKPEHWVD